MLEPQITGIPSPSPTPLSRHYWDGTATGELRYQRCTACNRANFGPSVACSDCRGLDLAWQVSLGLGRVYSWTVVWRPPTAGFEVPYAPAIVRLDEGYDMVSAIVGVELDQIAGGNRVKVEFHALANGVHLPFFGPT